MITQRRHSWQSFVGGELAPTMFGRVDLPRHAVGLRRARNCLITPQGAVENRPGTRFITSTKGQGRAVLYPFLQGDGHGLFLEVGDGYTRIHRAGTGAGSNLFLLPSGGSVITQVDVWQQGSSTPPRGVHVSTFQPHGFTPGMTIRLVGLRLVGGTASQRHELYKLLHRQWRVGTTLSPTAFELDEIRVNPEQANAERWSAFSALKPGQVFVEGRVYVQAQNPVPVEFATPWTYAQALQLGIAQVNRDVIITHPAHPPYRLREVGVDQYNMEVAPFNSQVMDPSAAPATLTLTATAVNPPANSPPQMSYMITAVAENGAETLPVASATVSNRLRQADTHNNLTWDGALKGAFRWRIYRSYGSAASSDSTAGFIGEVAGTEPSFRDDNIAADYSTQPPSEVKEFNAAGDYPSSVAFIEQRCVFAGSYNEPQRFWASNVGILNRFMSSFNPADDQYFSYQLSNTRPSPILHMLALRELLFFTATGVFRVAPVDGGGFTATGVSAYPVVSVAAHELAKPQEAGASILFPSSRNGHLFELRYADSVAGYDVQDLSVIAPHLIADHDWVQCAMQHNPYPVWWGLRNDGVLVALTYLPEQQVYAWHVHTLPGGFIESIAVVPEGRHDAVYLIVRRVRPTGEVRRYVERFEDREFAEQEDAFFVDCGITYRGPEKQQVNGLSSLEGWEVMVLADGRPLGPYTVDAGQITIEAPASVIHVGVPYESELQTLPVAYAQEEGYGLGVVKNVSAAHVQLYRSAGLEAGISFDDADMRPALDDGDDLLGAPPSLKTGAQEIPLPPSWDANAAVCLRQKLPLPFTATGLVVDYVDG